MTWHVEFEATATRASQLDGDADGHVDSYCIELRPTRLEVDDGAALVPASNRLASRAAAALWAAQPIVDQAHRAPRPVTQACKTKVS